MIDPARQAQLKEVIDRIVAGYGPDEIIVFGSWAWGVPDEGSDLDLFIVKDDPRRPIDRQVEVTRLFRGLKPRPPVDVFVYRPREREESERKGDPFVGKIVREGMQVYARRA
jgi:predicted nucleotidyltransferase